MYHIIYLKKLKCALIYNINILRWRSLNISKKLLYSIVNDLLIINKIYYIIEIAESWKFKKKTMSAIKVL